jgi:TnpA family transposase
LLLSVVLEQETELEPTEIMTDTGGSVPGGGGILR